MSYISMNVSEETKKRVETKLAELQDSMITDELIEEVFMQERKGIIRQAINEEMQRKGFKQIFASAIDNIINRQLHTAEEFLQKANVTSAECDIQRGQVLCKPGSINPHTKFKGQVYILTKVDSLDEFKECLNQLCDLAEFNENEPIISIDDYINNLNKGGIC